MICYFSKHYPNLNNAGNKAKTDIETIWQQQGFKNIGISRQTGKNKISGFLLTLASILKTSFSLRKNDILLIQYPLKKYYSFICRVARLKKANTITLIHDLGSFRRQKLTIPQEIKRLNQSHYIVAHNTSMQKWLQDNGLAVPCGCLGIFDYLSPEPATDRLPNTSHYEIVYAGALSPRKNQFLYQIGKFITNHRIHLYGKGFEPALAQGKKQFDYKGFIPSDKLIREVKGDFGLVWDGDSISACSGDWGHYLQYNNPHKTSLYIRCELPVIIWKKAALASFIKDNGIGICVDSLEELNDILNHLSPEDIINMKKNIKSVSQKLANGHYTLSATQTAIEKLQQHLPASN